MVGKGEECSPAKGYAISGQPYGNRAASSSVRPVAVVDGLPERVGTTALPPVSGSYAAAVWKQLARCPRSSYRVRIGKRVAAPPVKTGWVRASGMPGCFCAQPPR